MRIVTDEEGKVAIESLCHNAMKYCERNAFTQNLGFVVQVLSAVEIEKEEPPKPEVPAEP